MNEFYSVLDKKKEDKSWIFHIKLNPDHPVYEGHFPEQPVSPGVMLVNMIKDVIEKENGVQLILKQSRNIKFLKIITPVDTPELELHYSFIDDVDITCKVDAKHAGETYFKISATFAESL